MRGHRQFVGGLRFHCVSLRSLLCASVSTFALATASAQAADLTPQYKAPLPAPAGTTTLWVEGGAFWTASDPVFFTQPSAYDSVLTSFPSTNPIGTGGGFSAQVGWEAAIGVDYGFGGTPWHLSFDMRYGRASALGQALSASSANPTGTTTSLSNEKWGEREDHAVADIMFGREIGGAGILKFGLRAAELGADINESASLSTCGPATCPVASSSALLSADERSSFIGVGPRMSFEGHMPLGNSAWALEYLGGAADDPGRTTPN